MVLYMEKIIMLLFIMTFISHDISFKGIWLYIKTTSSNMVVVDLNQFSMVKDSNIK
jgi:hypothetical protein